MVCLQRQEPSRGVPAGHAGLQHGRPRQPREEEGLRGACHEGPEWLADWAKPAVLRQILVHIDDSSIFNANTVLFCSQQAAKDFASMFPSKAEARAGGL